MGNLENSIGIWRFGVFEVNAANLELRRNGVAVRIREQSFRVLVYLLEHAGELVSREDLRRVLWPADTYVDFDHSLNTAMMKLRDSLGDVADAPVYIETIPKRGYRFIAPVLQPAADLDAKAPFTPPAAGNVPAAAMPISTYPRPTRSSLLQHRLLLAVALLLAGSMAMIVFLLVRHYPGSRSAGLRERATSHPSDHLCRRRRHLARLFAGWTRDRFCVGRQRSQRL